MSESTREKKNIKYGVILSYGSMLVSFICTLLFTDKILDHIGDYNYGLYTFIGSITAWLTIATSALTASYLRFTSIEAAEKNTTSRTNTLYLKLFSFIGTAVTIIGLIVCGILFLTKVNFADYSWEDSKTMYILFAISIVNIGITTNTTVYKLFITYKSRFIFEKTLAVVIVVLNYVGQFIVAFLTKNIIALSTYVLLVSVFNIVSHYVYAKKKCGIQFERVSLKQNKNLIKSIAVFSGILLINSIVDQINSNVDKTLLGFFSKPEDVTVYQMGMQFNSYLVVMVVAISSVFAPKINKLVVEQKKEELDFLFAKVSRMQSIVVCCIAFGFVACGKEFIIWWIGESRVDAYYVGAVLMIINIMPLAVKTSVDIQRAMNKHYFRSIMYFAVAIINIALSIFFLHILQNKYAIYACLLGSIIASLLTQWTTMNVFNYKVIKLPMGKVLLRLFVCIIYGLGSTVIVKIITEMFINNIQEILIRLLLEIVVYIIVYLAFLVIFERKFIFSFLNRKKLH